MYRGVMLTLGLLISVACQPQTMPLTDEDVAAIRALGTSYAQANLAQDAEAAAAVYADSAIEMPPDEPATVGRVAIRTRYAAAFDAGMNTSEFSLTAAAIDGMNGLAYDRGTWTWMGTPPGMTDPVSVTGKHLVLAQKQSDGSWLWTAAIWNRDAPLPQPE